MTILRSLDTIPLDGGRLCLDFVNTVRNRKATVLHDYLTDYDQLVNWCDRLAIVDELTLRLLRQHALAHPVQAQTAWNTALMIRETIYSVFVAIARGQQPEETSSQTFNEYLARALSNLKICFTADTHSVEISVKADELLSPLWPVLKSAYDVLTGDERQRVKECGECGWLFFDSTKNNKRQWCNPLICGSTTKSKRYYHRQKQAGNA